MLPQLPCQLQGMVSYSYHTAPQNKDKSKASSSPLADEVLGIFCDIFKICKENITISACFPAMDVSH